MEKRGAEMGGGRRRGAEREDEALAVDIIALEMEPRHAIFFFSFLGC